jgi:glycosyltransferase involved in cell wall biosynthesis
MKLVFYSLVLNHHQACVADEFYKLLGENYAFVETARCIDNKGATEDYSTRPYLIRSWKSKKAYKKAMSLALNAEVCVFSGYEALPFEKARMRKGLLSFDMGERMLKRGWINLASTRIIKMVMAYHLGGWSKKPLYKLCCSAYAANDQYKLKTFQGKCYKWGYFTEVKEIKNDGFNLKSSNDSICIMWCARFLNWKHPELPVKLARKLKDKGYKFQIKMAGSGDLFQKTRKLIRKLDVDNCVSLIGNRTNEEILALMQRSQIFIFTSDQNEGWGAVANESMSNGCVLVASDAIGSTPYLIKEGVTGFSFKSCDVESLTKKVKWLIEHAHEMQEMQRNAYQQMKDVWNPKHAAESLLTLIKDIQNGQLSSIQEGPCSKA